MEGDTMYDRFIEGCYHEMVDEISDRVELGELTLEDADMLSDRAYDLYIEAMTASQIDLNDPNVRAQVVTNPILMAYIKQYYNNQKAQNRTMNMPRGRVANMASESARDDWHRNIKDMTSMGVDFDDAARVSANMAYPERARERAEKLYKLAYQTNDPVKRHELLEKAERMYYYRPHRGYNPF